MNFAEASTDLESLQQYLMSSRETLCKDSVHHGKRRCDKWGVPVERRVGRRRRMPGELACDTAFSAEDEIMRIMKGVLDRLNMEITTRFTRLRNLDNKFGFILDAKGLMHCDDLNQLRDSCTRLGNFYE